MRYKALLLHESGIDPPVRLRDLESASAADSMDEEAMLETSYVISKKAANKHFIPTWLGDNHEEPACEVSRAHNNSRISV